MWFMLVNSLNMAHSMPREAWQPHLELSGPSCSSTFGLNTSTIPDTLLQYLMALRFLLRGGHVEDTCKIDFHVGLAEYLLNGVGPRRTARCDERVGTVYCTIAMTPRVFLNAFFLPGTHR